MIDAKELRIGNLFIGYDDKVFAWDLPLFGLLDNGVAIDEIIKSPIPITEEWLLKFGYNPDKKYRDKIIFNGLLITWLSFEKNTLQIYDERGGFHYFIASVKYIHKLQNLYFALKDKELELQQ